MPGTRPGMTKEGGVSATTSTTLRIAIGDYPHTLPLKRGKIASPWLKLDFVDDQADA